MFKVQKLARKRARTKMLKARHVLKRLHQLAWTVTKWKGREEGLEDDKQDQK